MIIKFSNCICIVMNGVPINMSHAWSAGKFEMECQ